MIKKIVTIVLPILAVTATIFIFGIKVYQDSFDKFQYDGYVIGGETGKESTKYHFTKNEKYKVNTTNKEVEFTNSDEQEVKISDESFVHYADGSISSFKKAVVLNLDNVKSDSLQYYNIFKGSVFTKTSEGYQIKYLENKLLFKNFIVKISDTKYMIVGKNLEIEYGNKKEIIKDGFLEINYLDGNIIRVENQDFLLQNITNGFKILVDKIELDLLNKKIIYENETKVNLGEITIDSDDNIEIIPDKENTIIDQDELNKIEELENSPIITPGTNVDGMESGIVDTKIEKADEIINENEKIPDAVFKSILFNVTPSSIVATVSIEDSANTLKGDVTWKIIENATNANICQNKTAHGKKSVEIECATLSPETNYSLIVSSKYEKNEVTYEKDFLQRTFITPSAGITIEKDYVSTTLVAYKVKIPDTSSLTMFDYKVVESSDPTVIIQEGRFDRTHSSVKTCDNIEDSVNAVIPKVNECSVLIENLNPNTKYSLIINNIVHGTLMMPENFEIYKTASTLKEKPSFGNVNVITNKLSSTFTVSMNTVTDPNNSILSYRADIYPYQTQNDPSTIVTTREASIANQINIKVDEEVIQRRQNYIAKIYVTYFDNEKEYDILVGESGVLNMTSAEAPTIRFNAGTIHHDSISGEIIISDPEKTIVDGTVVFKIQNLAEPGENVITTEQGIDIDSTTISYSFTYPGLQAWTDYRFTVQAQLKLEEDINQPSLSNIGQFIVKTPYPEEQKAWIEDNTSNEPASFFAIKFAMTPNTYEKAETNADLLNPKKDLSPNEINDSWHTMQTLSYIKFRLRLQDYNEQMSDDECRSADYPNCWIFEYSDSYDDLERNSLIDLFFPDLYENGNAAYVPTFRPVGEYVREGGLALDLGLPEGTGLEKKPYVLEILSAKDYTDYRNDITFDKNSVIFYPNGEASSDVVSFEEKLIKNNTTGEPTGYKITTNQAINGRIEADYRGGNYTYNENFEHYLVNLNTKQTCQISDDYISEDGKTINITFNNYNNDENVSDACKIKRGENYGYYYEYILEITEEDHYEDHYHENGITRYRYGADKTFKPFKKENQPKRTQPKFDLVLTKTINTGDNIKYIFDYQINDPTHSLGTNPVIVYKDNANTTLKNVYCGEDYNSQENCVTINTDGESNGTFAVGKLNGTNLTLQTNITLLEEAKSNINLPELTTQETVNKEYSIEEEVNTFLMTSDYNIKPETIYNPDDVSVYYTIDESQEVPNAITYTFLRTDPTGNGYAINLPYSSFVEKFVGAKLTMEIDCTNSVGCNNQKVVLYKAFDDNNYQSMQYGANNPQITVSKGEFAQLMHPTDNIKTTVELLYDSNHYGFNYSSENDDAPYGIAIESYNNAFSFEKFDNVSGIFKNSTINDCDEKDCWWWYTPIELSNDVALYKIFNREKGKLYYTPEVGVKKYVQGKKLNPFRASCAEPYKCEFLFNQIVPTLLMKDSEVVSTYGGVNYSFNFGIAEQTKNNNFHLIIRYYSDADLSTPIKHNNTPYFRTFSWNELMSEYWNESTQRFEISETNLLQSKHYYAVFTWTDNPSDPHREQDFYSDPEWHRLHPNEERRIYEFSTANAQTFHRATNIYYQTGTEKMYLEDGITQNPDYEEYKKNEGIHPDFNRSLLISTSYNNEPGNVVDGYILELYIDKNDDANSSLDETLYEMKWSETDIPLNGAHPENTSVDMNPTQRTIQWRVSLDEKNEGLNNEDYFEATHKYLIKIIPYESCDSNNDPGNIEAYKCKNGRRKLPYLKKSGTYYINNPTVTITRIENTETELKGKADAFSFRLYINDIYRAVGKYAYKNPGVSAEIQEKAVYNVKIIGDNEVISTHSIELDKPTGTIPFNNITDCVGKDTCRVEVTYDSDRTNSISNSETVTIIKNINVSHDYDTGNMSIGGVSKDGVEIVFTNSFNISSNVKKVNFILSTPNYPDISITGQVPNISVNNNQFIMTLKLLGKYDEQLRKNQYYSLTLQLENDNGILLDEWSTVGISYKYDER